MLTEIVIDAPYPRDQAFRTSADYARLCRRSLAGIGRRHGGERRVTPEAPARRERALRVLLPFAVLALGILAWDLVVRLNGIPPYVLPGPGLVMHTLVADWTVLSGSLLVTLATTFEGLALAILGGVGLAVLFNQSRARSNTRSTLTRSSCR